MLPKKTAERPLQEDISRFLRKKVIFLKIN